MVQRRQQATTREAAEGRLLARPGELPAGTAAGRGLLRVGPEEERDGLLYVPDGYRAERPAPFVLLLHGAGGTAQHGMGLLQSTADEHGLILFAPDSRQQTWDMIMGGYGPDVSAIDRALVQVFSRYAVDPARVAVGGFSDGASYALSLGIANGDLFTHILAFSPGFMAPATQRGSPRIYISHGTGDRVLPIDRCSRRLVPELSRAGYDVRYNEFEGPHTVPAEVVRDALDWFGQEEDS